MFDYRVLHLVILFFVVNEGMSQQLKLVPSTEQPAAAFGFSISHTSDWLIAGAKDDTTVFGRTGAAYLFKYEHNAWVEKQKLIPDIGAAGDLFGISVSIFGDYAVVGANGDDTQGINCGAAYIYKRHIDTWTLKKKLLPHAGSNFDEYGISVAIDKELIVVGAYSDDNNGPYSGAAYIYSLLDDIWLEADKVFPEDGVANDKFGRSIATDGEKVIIGGVLNDDYGEDSGSAYIFSNIDGRWQQEVKLIPADGAANDRFGRSVGIDNEYAAVGSVMDDDNGNSSGSVYIYHYEADGWQLQKKIVAKDGQAEDFFGYSLSLNNRYLVVGAHNDDDFGMNSGAAYLFARTGDDWGQINKFNADEAQEGDNFGESVFLDKTWISFGAPYYTTNNGMTGAAFTVDAPMPVGIIINDASAFTVYPNPVANILQINLPGNYSSEIELTIHDLKGNNVLAKLFPVGFSSSITLDVADLQQGLYLVRVKSTTAVYTAKFCKR